MLSAGPAFVCFGGRDKQPVGQQGETNRCDAVVDLATAPIKAAMQTSLADAWKGFLDFFWYGSLSDIPIVNRFFGKDGKRTDEWPGKTAQLTLTAALAVFVVYRVATNKKLKEKTTGAMKYMNDCCKQNPKKVLQAHTRKWKRELNEENEEKEAA